MVKSSLKGLFSAAAADIFHFVSYLRLRMFLIRIHLGDH